MSEQEARDICKGFANQHRIKLTEEGECGFGRECVGFLDAHGRSYIDYNPLGNDYEPIKRYYCAEAIPPDGVDAYHKHDCLAVLGRGEEALKQLAIWVLNINKAGKVIVIEYQKQGGMDATTLFTGRNTGYTIMTVQ